MCYSLKSSITSFCIALITSYILYKRNLIYDRLAFPFIICYSFVQIAEALMWYDNRCGKINIIGNYIAYLSLITIVLGIGIGIYLIKKKYYGIVIGIIVILYHLYNMPNIKCSTIKNNLVWGFDSDFFKYIYIVCILLGLSATINSNINLKYIIIVLIWYSISYLYFYKTKYGILPYLKNSFYSNSTNNEIGSMWCHIASFSTPILYFIPYL